jgi:hypothetical protein
MSDCSCLTEETCSSEISHPSTASPSGFDTGRCVHCAAPSRSSILLRIDARFAHRSVRTWLSATRANNSWRCTRMTRVAPFVRLPPGHEMGAQERAQVRGAQHTATGARSSELMFAEKRALCAPTTPQTSMERCARKREARATGRIGPHERALLTNPAGATKHLFEPPADRNRAAGRSAAGACNDGTPTQRRTTPLTSRWSSPRRAPRPRCLKCSDHQPCVERG